MLEQKRHEVREASVEGAGYAAQQRDGVLLGGEARHCKVGVRVRKGGGQADGGLMGTSDWNGCGGGGREFTAFAGRVRWR
jgi:hypothetical protein